MTEPELHRINLYFETDLLDIIDEFAAITGRSRSYIIRGLLRPAMPSLQSLLNAAQEAKTDKEAVDARLSTIERALMNTVCKLPDAIEGKPAKGDRP